MNIASSVKLYILLLVIAGAIIFSAAGYTLLKTSDIQNVWVDFNQNRSDKNRSIRALREQIGFGGMIHNFKNYLLRRNIKNKEQVLLSLGGAKATLARYKLLLLSKEEIKAIEDISQTLVLYDVALNRIDELSYEGKNAKQIDQLVKVDDTAALEAMAVLETNMHEHANNEHSMDNSKTHLITNIREELGYGGMIHFYKNYILRDDQSLRENAYSKINNTLHYIDEYSKNDLSENESEAIKILRQYIRVYRARLSTISELLSKKYSPRKIDKKVIVDDKPILQSLNILEQETILQLEIRANNLSNSIDSIFLSSKLIEVATFLIVVLMAFGSYWFVNLKIVNPITSLIKVMSNLSKGDFDVDVKGVSNNNEIGDMARSVNEFKKAVQERIDFEKN